MDNEWNIIDMNLDYFDGYDSFCYQNCLRLMLKAAGREDAELYINASMSMLYCIEEDGIHLRYHKNIRSLVPSVNESVHRYYEKKDANRVFEENIQRIRRYHTPLIVGVDTFYLPYTSNYNKNHAKHTLILCGYQEEDDMVAIVDWYKPWFFRGYLPKEEFLKARDSKNEKDASIFSGEEIQNNWAEISEVPRCERKVLLIEMLQKSIDQFYDTKEPTKGIGALQMLINDIDKKSMNYDSLYHEVYLLIKRYEFWIQYLEIYEGLESNIELAEIIQQMKENMNLWETIRFLFMKQARSQKQSTVDKIKLRILQCVDAERIIAASVIALYHNLLADSERN